MMPGSGHQRGISLIELVIASGLSSLLALLLVHLYGLGVTAVMVQRDAARDLDNRIQLQHLLSHGIRDALVYGGSWPSDLASETACASLYLSNQCLPSVMVWAAGAPAPVVSPPALVNSNVLLLKQQCCPGVVADLYYLANRSGAGSGQSALFRRRLLSDGRFAPADEMIPDVQSFKVRLIRLMADPDYDRILQSDSVPFTEQWNTLALRVEAVLRPQKPPATAAADPAAFLFTVSARSGSWH